MANQKDVDYVASRRLMLEHSGFALSKTHGVSMRPLIWGGQHCVAVTPMKDEPLVGDLLLFRSDLPGGEERNVVHRLVEIRQEGDDRLYITRGDNCLGHEIVRRSEIIGKVAEVHRVSGFRPWHVIPVKKFTVTDPSYLRYSRFWMAVWPLRRLFYLLRAHANGLRCRLLSIFKR